MISDFESRLSNPYPLPPRQSSIGLPISYSKKPTVFHTLKKKTVKSLRRFYSVYSDLYSEVCVDEKTLPSIPEDYQETIYSEKASEYQRDPFDDNVSYEYITRSSQVYLSGWKKYYESMLEDDAPKSASSICDDNSTLGNLSPRADTEEDDGNNFSSNLNKSIDYYEPPCWKPTVPITIQNNSQAKVLKNESLEDFKRRVYHRTF
jgi:hypothetical protein